MDFLTVYIEIIKNDSTIFILAATACQHQPCFSSLSPASPSPLAAAAGSERNEEHVMHHALLTPQRWRGRRAEQSIALAFLFLRLLPRVAIAATSTLHLICPSPFS